jgi:hypothetical protein
MTGILLSLAVGWPAILITCGLALYGLLKSDHRFLVAAAVLALPFSWFLSGFPIIQSPIFLIPVLLFASGYAMHRDREMLAWFLAILFFLAVILLFMVILSGA